MSISDYIDVGFDYDGEKKRFLDNINFLKGLSVEEYTFYKKWEEVREYRRFINRAEVTQAKIWSPTDIFDEVKTIEEISNLNPTIEFVKTESEEVDWLMLRIFCHTMEFSQTPGRFLKLLITNGEEDHKDKRYLGCVSISSDVLSITDRDKYLEWTNETKLENNKRINNTSIGSCIMATQPFGYNFLGGKMVACLITTSPVRNKWQELYNNVLVGMTTTSLYGSYSMYNSLKWWHKCGSSAGKIPIKPDDTVYETWHHWLIENKAEKYEEMMTQKEGVSGPVTGAKQRVINSIFSELGLSTQDCVHGYQRGVYYAPFYVNTKEFLCDKIAEKDLVLKPLFLGDKIEIMNWWKPKAIERYKKLLKDKTLKTDTLFYKKMIDLNYDESKKLYYNDVGR